MNFARRRRPWAIVPIAVGLAACVSAADLPMVSWQGRTMGTTYTVKVVGTNLTETTVASAKRQVEECLTEVNRQLSHYRPDSEISRFNQAPAHAPFTLSPGFARVLRFSLELNRRSGGAFDPTLGPVIRLWGFGETTNAPAVPSEADLRDALTHTGCQHLALNARNELTKDIPGLGLNLSSTAKGFGVDEVVDLLRAHGWTNLYVAIAGDVRVLGHSPRNTRWQVGISAPMPHWTERDPVAAVVALSDQAISTSGDYQRFFTNASGRRLGHILDPQTGWPVQHQVDGVTVVAPDSMTASGLATTLFVLGPAEGLKFIETWTNAAALFLLHEAPGDFRSVPSSRFAELTGTAP